jgi:hypothetical protein
VWGSKSPSEAFQPPPTHDQKPSREHIGAVIVPISTRVLSQVTAACAVFIASRNGQQPIRMVTRSVVTSETAQHAAPKPAPDGKRRNGLDGYQML